MLLATRILFATLSVALTASPALAGLSVPPPSALPPAPSAPRLWFDGGDPAVIAALQARVTDPVVAGFYASFKGFVDSRLGLLVSQSTTDDTRSMVAKAAALLHVLGKTPPAGTPGYATYADVAFTALGAIGGRQAVDDLAEWYNPPPDAIDVLTDSSRLQSMAEAYDLLAGVARPPATDEKVRAIIAEWANALRNDWNLTGAYGFPGHRDNWGIKAGATLVTTALALPDHADAAAWLASGMAYLNESLDAVASATGWFKESPWYLNYSLANLVPTAYHVRNALALDWFSPLEPLVDAAFAVRQPDGRAPPFEEGLPNVFPWDVLAGAYPARTATMKWAWAQSPQTVANFDNQQIHSVTRFLVDDTTTIPSAPTWPSTSFLGGDTSAAFLRTSWLSDALSISTMTALDTSALTAWPSRHNIQNPLDLILHARGALLVPTSGGGPLVTRSDERDTYLSPLSKNLPLIEGSAPFVVDPSAVSFGARLDSRDAGARPQHFADLVMTEVSGYSSGGRARRVVALIDDQYAAVFDHLTVTGNRNRTLALSWRGRGQRTQVSSTKERAANRWSYGQARVQIDTTATGDLSTDSNESLYADAWGHEEDIDGVIVKRSTRALSLVSVLQAYPGSASAMAITTSSTATAAALTIASQGGPDLLLSAPGTAPATAAGVTLAGKAAIVRKSGPAAAVVEATSLAVDGVSWLVASPAATLAWTVSGDGFVATVSADGGTSFTLVFGHTGLDLTDVYAASVDGVPVDPSRLVVSSAGFRLKDVPPGTIVVGPAPCRVGTGEDPDGDRVCGDADVCPTVYDPDQLDTDGDGVGDACECLDAAERCDDGSPCTTDRCVATTGACEHLPIAVSTSCDDGSACTSGDRCEHGECVGTPITCNDQNPCTIDSCDPDSGCTATPTPGESCDDHDVCTVTDRCDAAGHCVGSAIDCDDGNPCTVDTCGPNGACTHTAAAPGLACDDDNACTTGDHCAGAACVGVPIVCDDHNPCTADACEPAIGCIAPAVPAGTPCDDRSACTTDDACVGTLCVGAALGCDDGDPCTLDACDPSVGCFSLPAPFGEACDDGSACTTGDLCVGGTCIGVAVSCDDQNDCTADRCDPASGCVADPQPGAPCDDGSACTSGDACDAAGACVGVAVSCGDDDPCTIDSCDASAGCVATPAAPGTPCDDGDPCTVEDACGASGCAGGGPRDCDDGNPCTANACEGGVGCVTTVVDNGAPCDDGDPCTVGDACAGGVCRGAAASCDDGDPCTVDACDPVAGCVSSPAPAGTACDDGDACTVSDACGDGDGVCAGLPRACDDGDPCTIDACVAGGECVHDVRECPRGTACEAGECVETACAACDGDGDCVEGDVCLLTTAGYRCLARCDDGRGCEEEGATCAPVEEGLSVCLAPDGDCAELPPASGDEGGGGDDVVEGPVADEGPEDTGAGAEVVEVVEAVEVVEEVVVEALPDTIGGDDSASGDVAVDDIIAAGDVADSDLDAGRDALLGLGGGGPQSFSGDEAGGCGGCAAGRGAPGAAGPLFVLLGLLLLRRRAARRARAR